MRIAILLSFLAFPALAHATDWGIPSDALDRALPKGCDASADAGLYNCADQAFKKADAELNEVWKKVLATIQPSDTVAADKAQEWKEDLIAAQQAWNTFKDKDCDGARSFEYWGGSGRALAVLSCQYEYTVNRTKDLKARYLEQ
jgi:uncharacterized protein YecT (DUF1311 family)